MITNPNTSDWCLINTRMKAFTEVYKPNALTFPYSSSIFALVFAFSEVYKGKLSKLHYRLYLSIKLCLMPRKCKGHNSVSNILWQIVWQMPWRVGSHSDLHTSPPYHDNSKFNKTFIGFFSKYIILFFRAYWVHINTNYIGPTLLHGSQLPTCEFPYQIITGPINRFLQLVR